MTNTLGLTCQAADLLPTPCHGPLHRHHVTPISAGGDPDGPTILLCERHHPSWEAVTRRLIRPRARRCRHRHPYPQGREECERRLNRAA